MNKKTFRRAPKRGPQSGQAMLFVLLGLGIFLLGAMAFAIDMGHLWFRRQSAQTAADAACTAGAMDLLGDATSGSTTLGNFGSSTTAAVAFDCKTKTPTPAPCTYAALNGFNSNIANGSTAIGNNVYVDFPSSVSGVTTPPTSVAPTAFMRVTVTDNTPTFFAGMLGGIGKQSIKAYAVCGVTQSAAPIPILVLDSQSPNINPNSAALNIAGTGLIQIFGGPSRSIQVDSLAASGSCGQSNCSVNLPWGSSQIDLSHAGPNNNGADMGVSGGPAAQPGGFIPGTEGHWLLARPIGDPYSQVCYPGQDTTTCTGVVSWGSNTFNRPAVPTAANAQANIPSDVAALGGQCATYQSTYKVNGNINVANIMGGGCHVAYKFHGCPDQSSGCTYYMPGPYPDGIDVKTRVAVFDPGLYYISSGVTAPGLKLEDQSIVRNGTGNITDTYGPTIGSSGGVTFYYVGTATVSVSANAGNTPGSDVVDSFNSMKGPVDGTGTPYPIPSSNVPSVSSMPRGVQCDVNSTIPSTGVGDLYNGGNGISINGNILLGPCIGYYGDPLGTNEPTATSTPKGPGEQRGFLFFQDRSAQSVNPSWGGGGQFLLAGTMYFHSCKADGSGNAPCGAPPAWLNDVFALGGNSGSTTYVLGSVITDNLKLQGSASLAMDLNPTTAFNILKAALYQ